MQRSLPTGRERFGYPLHNVPKDEESLFENEKKKDQLPWTPFAPNVSLRTVRSSVFDNIANSALGVLGTNISSL